MNVRTPLATEDIRRAYRKWATHYEYTFALISRRYLKKVIPQFNQDTTGRVLDVGIGTGLSLDYLAASLSITGIDLSADMLEKAEKRRRKRSLTNVKELRVMDASKLEFEDNYFDGVLATYVLSVVDNPAQVMLEMCRVCNPGGMVYVFNHIKSQKEKQPLLAMLEKTIAPSSKLVGFHSDFSHELLQAEHTHMQLVEQHDYGPMGLFTLLKFKKPMA